jgi:hypothetical protein
LSSAPSPAHSRFIYYTRAIADSLILTNMSLATLILE